MILNKINNIREFAHYKPVLKKAIIGSYSSSGAMKQELIELLQDQKNGSSSNHLVHRPKLVSILIESGGIIFLVTTFYLLSLLILYYKVKINIFYIIE